MNTPLIEACVDSYASCRAAYRGGADRLELCAHLVIGGTTPSTALFRQVQRDIPVKTNILIRPRFGDFLYSKEELEQMCEEIRTYRELGANGVVIGALTPDGDLDLDAMRRLMNCAGNMDVTLHRAFDMTRDPFAAMEDAIRLGCKTILTSGQQKDPLTGAELLRELFEQDRYHGGLRRKKMEHSGDPRQNRHRGLPHDRPQGRAGQRNALPEADCGDGPAVAFRV